MDSGALKHQVVFEKFDEELETWSTTPYYKCSAYINGLSGSEYWAASAVQAENTVDFTVRYCCKIGSIIPQLFRIIFEGNSYDIITIDNIRFENKFVKFRTVRKYG